MNARLKDFNLNLDIRQVPDAITCIFHSLLLHRSTAKFHYKTETNFQLGSLGIKEVECEFIDLCYVRVNSDELAMRVDEDVRAFHQEVERNAKGRNNPVQTQISMEFFHRRRKSSWLPLIASEGEENVPWERWNVNLVVNVRPHDELSSLRESAAEAVSDIILSLCSCINKPQYLPKMPTKKEIADVFDEQFSDVQPYLFTIIRNKGPSSQTSGTLSTMKKLMKDTLFI
ncbi:hypothetical protein PMAYCL1PPCAC_18603 [Pristionchus mayeri]|uniref:Autophagy-related protein 101 n=1 Tax=Pristionchus mayeri TaxID=1317129 RepID=A0AAN5CPS5_9BILA|nr:hypothetical protein PMAYCL1PPCAC_18603 [Pristionchus mayeri]